jgi:c(7)-type cytochrome triheme protein
MNRKMLLALALILLFCGQALTQTGTKKKRPLPYEYGQVIINNYSEKADLAPVVFQHWIHRSRFTCRVCHVDIGFAMKAGATNIKAIDNERGYYCGTCHNAKMVTPEGKTVFLACSKKVSFDDERRCARCHSRGKNVASDYDFFKFSQPLPKERFGNGIDWEKAEQMGLIKPVSFLDNVTPRKPLVVQKDFELNPKVEGMPDIIFSHQKHTDWNGCELCHPDIFFGVKKGTSHYSMVDISQGKFCGACHISVAFPLTDCQRCHSKPVGQ